MANYNNLLSTINGAIKTNGTGAITGQLLQTVLDGMVTSLGAGYQYMGVATPSTNPGTPDQNVFYIAGTEGTYTNFNNIVVANEVAALVWNGSWSKQNTGIKFVSVSQNTSTGHTDINIGSDSYPVASVGEVNQLGQDVKSNLIHISENEVIATKNTVPITEGAYLNINGTESPYEGAYYSGYIRVKGGASYDYYGRLTGHATICYYNIYKELIGTAGSFPSSVNDYTFTTPTNCAYIRASVIGNYNLSITSNEEYTIPIIDLEPLHQGLKLALAQPGDVIMASSEMTMKNNYYLTGDGGEAAFNGFAYTENYIPVIPGGGYKYTGYLQSGASIVFYDIEKNVISAINPGSGDPWTEKEFVTPANCAFIRCSTKGYPVNIYANGNVPGNVIVNYIEQLYKGLIDSITDLYVGQKLAVCRVGDIVKPESEMTMKSGYFLTIDNREISFSGFAYTENYIDVIPNGQYKYTGYLQSAAAIVFYDINKKVLGGIAPGSGDPWTEKTFTTPTGCAYIRCSTRNAPVNIYANGVIPGNFVVKYVNEYITYIIKETAPVNPTPFYPSFVGDADIQNIIDSDYCHIIFYGQSLSCGVDTPGAMTTTPIPGCYMVGSSLEDYGTSIVKNPLVNVSHEHPVVATTNCFARLYRQFVKPSMDFFASSCGMGSKTIAQLSKGGELYMDRFLNQVNRVHDCVEAENKSVVCPAIVYLQGENDVNPGFTPKDDYKAAMLQLKNDMQADIMNIYGQSFKPLFFIYSVSNRFNSQLGMNIPMAQIEFADENDDVFLLNPYYAMPSYQRLHMSENGYRWYGVLTAKSLFEVLTRAVKFSTIVPKQVSIIGARKIQIDFYVPVPPLEFDSVNAPYSPNQGFNIFKDSVAVQITNVEIYGGCTCVIETSADIDSGTIEVYYAMAGSVGYGIGNVRDSDRFSSFYTYINDTNEIGEGGDAIYYHPTQLYGKKYPLFNWCAPFYYQIVNP